MADAHTPGPWLVATSNSRRRIVSRDHARVCEPVIQIDGHPNLYFRNGGFDGPDARLIAAAPDLLAAAKGQHQAIDMLMAMLIKRDPTFMPTKSAVWPMLLAGNAAIAKATGQGRAE